MDKKPPIINCHAHIFTGDHVPPYIGKTILRTPLWWFLNFNWIFKLFRWWYQGPNKKKYDGEANEKRERKYLRKMWLQRNGILNFIVTVVGLYLTLQAVDILCHWLYPDPSEDTWVVRKLLQLHDWLWKYYIILDINIRWVEILLLLVVVVFFRSGRNFLFFILKQTFALLRKLPGKETKELFDRYLAIGRFAFHKEQKGTLTQLANQYPNDSGFVILPMDMEYMEAGKVKQSYRDQMKELAALKASGTNLIYPFVFADPRRIAAEPDYFKYKVVNGEVVLEDCFIKEYIESKEFSGFKIYPALGYYPFDPLLLPLWKYAEQKGLPVLTHCVRGPMYFRGTKTPLWDHHPVFRQKSSVSGVYTPLLLPETKNDQFSANFTHPMNFLCLLEKQWLAPVINQHYKKTKDEQLKELFGLVPAEKDEDATILHGLRDLKICLAHYGGNDEWQRYLEQDRYSFSNELAQTPDWGIEFLYLKNSTKPSLGKPELLWKYCDWYSIISSMMLQYPNVYADISYILHSDSEILPLLMQTLRNDGLRGKVLYGTDFFVVRNHKSDKSMLAGMMGGLDEEDFDQIARYNPRKFLNLDMAG